jgi:hypothetical protein
MSSYAPPAVSEASYGELVDFMAGVTLSLTPDAGNYQFQSFQSQARSAMPQIEKYAPGRVPGLKQWLKTSEPAQDPSSKWYTELNDLTQKASVDQMLESGEQFPVEMQPQVFQQAAWKALNANEPQRARQIIKEKIADPWQRQQMLTQIDNQVLWKAAAENTGMDLNRLFTKRITAEQRVQTFINAAMNSIGQNNKKTALEYLANAKAIIATLPPNASLWLELQVSSAYQNVDPGESFAILQSVIGKANQLIAAAVVMDGFESRYLKEGEWMTQSQSGIGNLVRNIDETLAQLARHDLDRARDLSDQLERPEIKLMAQVEIARAALGGSNVINYIQGRRFIRRLNVSMVHR